MIKTKLEQKMTVNNNKKHTIRLVHYSGSFPYNEILMPNKNSVSQFNLFNLSFGL